jgi:heat shock protein HslJ
MGTAVSLQSLVFAITFALAGCAAVHEQLPTGPPRAAWEQRIAATRQELPGMEKYDGWSVEGDFEFIWNAYFRNDTLRYIREYADQREFGSSEFEYWFTDGALSVYQARGVRHSAVPGGDTAAQRIEVTLVRDSLGKPVLRSKTVNGDSTGLLPLEVNGAAIRSIHLVAEALNARRSALLAERPRAPVAVAGRLSMAGGRLRFSPCASSRSTLMVADLPDGGAERLLEEFGAGPAGAHVLVELEGDRLTGIRYAAPEGPDCGRLPGEGDLRAAGNEPFWSLAISADSAVLTTPEQPGGTTYVNGRWSSSGPRRWTFAAGGGLNLDLEPVPCTDNMSGARFPFRVRLTVPGLGADLPGCALEGRGIVGGSAEDVGREVATSLAGSWRLTELAGRPPLSEHDVTLEFPEPGRVAGTTGCNRYFGKTAVTPDSMRLGPLGMTRMACGDSVGAQERAFLGALERVERWTLEAGVLTLHVRQGAAPLRFRRR